MLPRRPRPLRAGGSVARDSGSVRRVRRTACVAASSLMDYASQKARGRGARRAKARHSGVSNADKRAGRGRGRAADTDGDAGRAGGALAAARGRGRGRGGNAASGGGGGWRSRRSKVPEGATNAWRYEESDASASLFERRTEQGEDIGRLLADQSGAALGAVFPSQPATAGAGELDLCRLATTLSALNPAERLRLDPTLFVAGEPPNHKPLEAAVAAKQRRSEELAKRADVPQQAGRGRGRGRGRGQANHDWAKAERHAGGDQSAAWAGPALAGRGRGRGRREVAGHVSPSPSPSPVEQELRAGTSSGTTDKGTAELDDFLDSLQ